MKGEAARRDDWLLVDQDESWFSRFAQPAVQAYAPQGDPLHLVERIPPPDEPDKAIACYGAVSQLTAERWLFLAEGQPNSDLSVLCLQALLKVAQAKHKRVLVVIWDRASWHKSQVVKNWVRQHNQKVKRKQAEVRLLTVLLPTKSPWLNPMEPIWYHTKRKVVEPDGELSVKVLKERLCAQFHTTLDAATLKTSG